MSCQSQLTKVGAANRDDLLQAAFEALGVRNARQMFSKEHELKVERLESRRNLQPREAFRSFLRIGVEALLWNTAEI